MVFGSRATNEQTNKQQQKRRAKNDKDDEVTDHACVCKRLPYACVLRVCMWKKDKGLFA